MIIADMTMPEFTSGITKSQTVIIPFGSTEEHGSHLPLDTDTIQAVEVCLKLSQLRNIFIAPPVHYGVCRSTSCHPGTISISVETLKSLAIDICSALYHDGLRNFILFTGHAGSTHGSALIDAGEVVLATFPDCKVAVLTEYLLAASEGRPLIETKNDAHAGEIETSRIMHSHPHLVKGGAPEEYPTFPAGILVRDKKKFWPGGVWGDPTKATAVKGSQIEALVVKKLNEFVDKLESFTE